MPVLPDRIVSVDDDKPVSSLIKVALEKFQDNITVITCNSGKELIARFQELQPDLVLLDLMMPEMNGVDVLEALNKKESYAHTPVIFTTGRTQLTMNDHYRQLGVIGVLHKPFEVREMGQQILDIWTARSDPLKEAADDSTE